MRVAEKHPRLFPLILDRYFSPGYNTDTIDRESVKLNERYRAEQMKRLLDDVYGEENIERKLKTLTPEEQTIFLSEKILNSKPKYYGESIISAELQVMRSRWFHLERYYMGQKRNEERDSS